MPAPGVPSRTLMAIRRPIAPKGPCLSRGCSLWGTMSDIIMIMLVLGLFALGIGLAHACEGL